MEKSFKFPQEWQRDENIQAVSSAIRLEGWTMHFEHE